MEPQETSNFDADYHPTGKRQRKNFKRWDFVENQLYIEFLKKQEDNFREEKLRRTQKVFKRLSEFIGTKNHCQCKSHHQKMVKHHRTIQKIVEHFTKIIRQNKKIEEKTKVQKVKDIESQKADQGLTQRTNQSSISNIFDVLQTKQK